MAKQPTRVGNILPDLESLAFPVDNLLPLPGNPRKGDVKAVARSYAAFGQRKPIVARRQGDAGIVIAGNHQLEAAKSLGWSHLAVVWVDDDEMTAAAFALADNRTADLGTYDDDLVLAMLNQIDDVELLAATAYSAGDIAKLAGDEQPMAAEDQSDDLQSVWSVIVSCKDELEQIELIQRLSDEGMTCRSLIS